MRHTQVQSFVQTVQVQNQSSKNPAVGNTKGVVDFLQIIQQLISTSDRGAAGASPSPCTPRAGKNELFSCENNPPGSDATAQALTGLPELALEGVSPQTPEIQQEPCTTFLPEDMPVLYGGIHLEGMLASFLFNPGNRGAEQFGANTGTIPGILQPAHAMTWIMKRAALGTPGGNGWAAEPVNKPGTSQEQPQQVLQAQQVLRAQQVLQVMKNFGLNGSNSNLNQVPKHMLFNPAPQPGEMATGHANSVTTAFSSGQGGVLHAATSQAVNTAGYEFNGSSPASAAAKPAAANNAQQAETANFTLNTVDSTLSPAGHARGETAPAVRTEQPLFLQLAEAIRGQVVKDSHGQTHLRLQLYPESLGEVVVKIVYKDGNLTTHFQAATEGAKQAIESSFSQLREALAAHQLNLQQSTVSTGSDHGSWAQESSGERYYPKPFSGQQQGNQNNKQGEPPLPETTCEPQQLLYRLNHFV